MPDSNWAKELAKSRHSQTKEEPKNLHLWQSRLVHFMENLVKECHQAAYHYNGQVGHEEIKVLNTEPHHTQDIKAVILLLGKNQVKLRQWRNQIEIRLSQLRGFDYQDRFLYLFEAAPDPLGSLFWVLKKRDEKALKEGTLLQRLLKCGALVTEDMVVKILFEELIFAGSNE